jgi:hypothetical protein
MKRSGAGLGLARPHPTRRTERNAARTRARLAELVAFARARSPYYRALYAALPPG